MKSCQWISVEICQAMLLNLKKKNQIIFFFNVYYSDLNETAHVFFWHCLLLSILFLFVYFYCMGFCACVTQNIYGGQRSKANLQKSMGSFHHGEGSVQVACWAWCKLFAPCALTWLYGRSSALLNLLSLICLRPLHQICDWEWGGFLSDRDFIGFAIEVVLIRWVEDIFYWDHLELWSLGRHCGRPNK